MKYFCFLICLFTFGCAGSLLLLGLSFIAESRGYSAVVRRLLIAVASLVAELKGPRA